MKITEEFLRQEQLKRDKKHLIMMILIIILCIISATCSCVIIYKKIHSKSNDPVNLTRSGQC